MIFSSIEQMGEVPFKTVFIHGLVRDAQGRKMSKSLGNGIDPLEVIAQYGADALRLTLATGNSPGNDMRFSDDKIMASRNFCNKIWNAARFILMNLGDEELEPGLPSELEIEDKWVLSKYNEIVRQVTQNIDKFELGIALGKVNEFVWDIVCDWYIEIVKLRLQAGGEQKKNALRVLCTLFEGTMKLLHPFAPFITEEIWQTLPHQGESIMTAPWPVYDPALSFAREEEQFEIIMKAIRAIRNRRSELQVPPSKKAKVFIETERVEVFSQGEEFIKRLASASEVAVAPQLELEGMVMAITAEAKIGMPMDDLVDREKECQRLEKEKLGCEKEIASLTGKLQNEKFVSRAPRNVVDAEREKLARAQERLKKVEESLAAL